MHRRPTSTIVDHCNWPFQIGMYYELWASKREERVSLSDMGCPRFWGSHSITRTESGSTWNPMWVCINQHHVLAYIYQSMSFFVIVTQAFGSLPKRMSTVPRLTNALEPSIVFVCDRTESCPINSTNVQQSIEIVVKITVQSDRYVLNIAETFPLNRKYNFQMVMIRCCPQYMWVRESTRLDRRVCSIKINFPKSNWVLRSS